MAFTFGWKPALVGARCEVKVDEAGAELKRGSRIQRVNFSEVAGGRLLELNMRTSSVSLVLMHRGGKFAINHGGQITDAAHDENAAAFVAASAAILEGLARVKPGVQLELGGGPGVRWTMAVLGAVMAILGALLVLIPLVEGRMDFEGIALIVMAILIALSGGAFAMRYNPFAKLPTAAPADLARVLRSHLPKG